MFASPLRPYGPRTRSGAIADRRGTAPIGSNCCKSLQMGHLRPQPGICPDKSRFRKVTFLLRRDPIHV